MIWFLNLSAASAPSSHPQPTPSQPGGARGPAAAPARGNRHPLGDAPFQRGSSGGTADQTPRSPGREGRGRERRPWAATPRLGGAGRSAPKQQGRGRLGPSQSTWTPSPQPLVSPGPLPAEVSGPAPPRTASFHLDLLPDASRHISRSRPGLPGSAPFLRSLRGNAPSNQQFLAPIRLGSLGRRSWRRQHSHRKVSRAPSEAWAAAPRSHFEKLPPVVVRARLAVT